MAERRYIAHFQPQDDAWPESVKAQRIDTWDCTDYLAILLNRDGFTLAGCDSEVLVNEINSDRYSGVADALKGDPAAPAWVRAWSGPFTITVRRTDG